MGACLHCVAFSGHVFSVMVVMPASNLCNVGNDSNVSKANQSILLVSTPPILKVLCRRAVIIHYSICHFEGVASWNHPKN